MNLAQYEITCIPDNAPKFQEWIKSRGGIAVWRSLNLSNPDRTWSTPANQKDGTPMQQPTWEADTKPEKIVKDPTKVGVVTDREVKRFHVAIRPGTQNFLGTPLVWKCTDKSSARIRGEVAKAGKGSHYKFDYDTQEVVIYSPVSCVSLDQWKGAQ